MVVTNTVTEEYSNIRYQVQQYQVSSTATSGIQYSNIRYPVQQHQVLSTATSGIKYSNIRYPVNQNQVSSKATSGIQYIIRNPVHQNQVSSTAISGTQYSTAISGTCIQYEIIRYLVQQHQVYSPPTSGGAPVTSTANQVGHL